MGMSTHTWVGHFEESNVLTCAHPEAMCTVLAIVMVKSPLDGVKYATSLCSECGVTVTRPANTRYFSPALADVANVLRMMLLSGTDSLTGDRALSLIHI